MRNPIVAVQRSRGSESEGSSVCFALLTLYDSVLDAVVANGAYRAINIATFNAGFKLA